MKRILIIGRPNVGKSTLFNRLSGKAMAIVHDLPGVTRDWRESNAQLGDLRFKLIDTAGLEGFEDSEIKSQIKKQNQQLLSLVDGVLFMVDAQDGVLSSDIELAKQLRPFKDKVILVANKAESKKTDGVLLDFFRLGFEEATPISAAHGDGLQNLYEALQELLGETVSEHTKSEQGAPLHLAFVGRPNAGKSTLINSLIGEDRLLTGEQPGITRDAVAIDWTYKRRAIRLFDTAGMRKRGKVDEDLEQLSIRESLKAIRFAQVVVLVVDAETPLEKQDLTIASYVVEEGRALVVAVNKWDKSSRQSLEEIQARLEEVLPQVKGVFCVPISATLGQKLDVLMNKVLESYDLWDSRLPTGALNRWLEEALERHPPPVSGLNRIRIKYMTQIKSRPPTFTLFVTKPVELPKSYVQYLSNSLRQTFKLPGIPLRFLIRKTKNPYAGKK
ncbi:ribosome biogenesis GTPase Der [Candidatus Nucleicultrix amoebiphila]|jgi:GTP-binding protein|uniref:GTPase Der n=1 Tax=Candidatus Nucleicultrix amoebiphila FS5 TaxID=1414854 RepID=A0A1W6N4H6_9PROT|nr:ribosome biogenesis GTPase Der [Candidatus Nucleicultrix amoebiphila]ARN84754.1 hypothetical protein GQ61_04975 [Candidatus Nucleicultrix amoebiphila FS5]